jgi:AraC-like DNA-binding protein
MLLTSAGDLMAGLHYQPLHSSPVVTLTDVRCHAHDTRCAPEEEAQSHQIVWVRRGVFLKHGRNGAVLAEPGQALFFNHRESFRVSHPLAAGDDCMVLSFPAQVIADVAGADPVVSDCQAAPFVCPSATLRPEDLLAYQRLRRSALRAAHCSLEVEERALGVLRATLARALRTANRKPACLRRSTQRRRQMLVADVRVYLARHFVEKLSLPMMARAVGSSPYHLCVIFKQVMGMPIHRYLLQLRMAYALEGLADAKDLTSLALDLGFSSHAHFSSSFRRMYGLTPSSTRAILGNSKISPIISYS